MPIHEIELMPYTYSKHETLLKLDNVGLRYGPPTGGRWILRGVSTEVHNINRPDVEQGQVVCFLGPSGVGKTQLARLIAGLHHATEGTISMADGTPVGPGRCGFVAQHYPLFQFMRVQDQLVLAAKLGGVRNFTAKIGDYLSALGMEGQDLSKFPRQFSGGQRQRLAIIRQLLCSEHFIILDEPFSGLDIKAKSRACALIQQVAQMHTLNTIIIITHDVTEGMSVADTVWLMGKPHPDVPASIVETYDLAAEGLAWKPDIHDDARFREYVVDVKHRFLEVAP